MPTTRLLGPLRGIWLTIVGRSPESPCNHRWQHDPQERMTAAESPARCRECIRTSSLKSPLTQELVKTFGTYFSLYTCIYPSVCVHIETEGGLSELNQLPSYGFPSLPGLFHLTERPMPVKAFSKKSIEAEAGSMISLESDFLAKFSPHPWSQDQVA